MARGGDSSLWCRTQTLAAPRADPAHCALGAMSAVAMLGD